MAIVSNGVLVKSTVGETFTPASWNGWPQLGITQAFRWGSYSAIYQRQMWIATLVDKIANATARLPFKVYERAERGRPEARGTPYAELLRQPNSELDPFLFWLWVVATLNVYGEAFLLKRRDAGGRPVELFPWHPTAMWDDVREDRVVWFLQRSTGGRVQIDRRDFVHLRFYNPDSLRRGLSPLEPLRSTLENEDGARRANSAMWRNGGRPAVVLQHPKLLNDGALKRLKAQWDEIHSGVDNWAKAAILEEGMQANILPLNVEELQYVEARRLNREECCARYDVPPPVVHILDRATFSNITEQMRSMYRDTMAPRLKMIESTFEMELRDGRFGATGEPDFGANVYGEFLMDEVLRGDFETRSDAYQKGVNAGYLTPAEIREMENLPFKAGSDQLFINSTMVPIASQADPPAPAGVLPAEVLRSLMGRLSRQKSIDEVDASALIDGLNGESPAVLAALTEARADGIGVAEFRERLRALGG